MVLLGLIILGSLVRIARSSKKRTSKSKFIKDPNGETQKILLGRRIL